MAVLLAEKESRQRQQDLTPSSINPGGNTLVSALMGLLNTHPLVQQGAGAGLGGTIPLLANQLQQGHVLASGLGLGEHGHGASGGGGGMGAANPLHGASNIMDQARANSGVTGPNWLQLSLLEMAKTAGGERLQRKVVQMWPDKEDLRKKVLATFETYGMQQAQLDGHAIKMIHAKVSRY